MKRVVMGHQRPPLTPPPTHTDLFGVHVAVVVQVLVVQGEASWVPRACGRTDTGAPLDVLTHHQHGVVEHALGALGHGVHPDHKYDVYDALQANVWEKGDTREG